jgi:hypothetical protein
MEIEIRRLDKIETTIVKCPSPSFLDSWILGWVRR